MKRKEFLLGIFGLGAFSLLKKIRTSRPMNHLMEVREGEDFPLHGICRECGGHLEMDLMIIPEPKNAPGTGKDVILSSFGYCKSCSRAFGMGWRFSRKIFQECAFSVLNKREGYTIIPTKL